MIEIPDLSVNITQPLKLTTISSRYKSTTTPFDGMPVMKDVVDYFKQNNKNVKVVIGGAPVTQEFADSIDADGFGEDANLALQVVDSFLKKQIKRTGDKKMDFVVPTIFKAHLSA